MTTLSVSANTATGFYPTPIAGTGRDAADVAATQTEVAQAQALAEAIAQALEQARALGITAFRPADASVLTLPAGLSATDRDALFLSAVGRSYAGSELTLAQWSDALRVLEHRAGAKASTLPPGAGGGILNVHGTWYVNGRAWSLAEVYTANRVNTYAELDTLLAASLNVIAANNEVTKALTALMKNLFKKYKENEWLQNDLQAYKDALKISNPAQWGANNFLESIFPSRSVWPDVTSQLKVNKNWVDKVGTEAITNDAFWELGNAVNDIAGTPLERPVSFDTVLAYANQYIGPNSKIKAMAEAGVGINDGLNQADFRALIDEVEAIIGGKASDNQVAALRNEAISNSRSAILEGLGSFLKGQQTMGSTTARNA